MSALDIWKNRLIDTSSRNPLLSFKFTTKEGKAKTNFVEMLNIEEPQLKSLLQGKSLSFDQKGLRTHLDLLVREPKKLKSAVVEINPEPQIQFLETDPLSLVAPAKPEQENPTFSDILNHTGEFNLAQRNRVLMSLRNKDRLAEQETGLNILFLALGFLKWFQGSNTEPTYSPLFLIPLDLEKQGTFEPKFSLILDEGENIVFNPTLKMVLKQSFGLDLNSIPEKFEDELPTPDQFQSYFQTLKDLIQDHPQWEIIETRKCIASFHFANLVLYKEMEKWGFEMEKHPIISRFCSNEPLIQPDFRSAQEIDKSVSAEKSYTVIDADASQVEAIQAAKDGISFVLDGPPGTGKSQTIINIIAELLAEGKKVLFVSQKKAALDVVRARMDYIGLGHLCLDLHDHTQSNLEFIQTLYKCFESLQLPAAEFQHNAHFLQLEKIRSELNQLAEHMHTKPGKREMSFFQLYSASSEQKSAPDIRFQYEQAINTDDIQWQETLDLLKRLEQKESVYLTHQTHPWREVSRTKPLSLVEKEDLHHWIETIQTELNTVLGSWNTLIKSFNLQSKTSLNAIEDYQPLIQKLTQIPALPDAWLALTPASIQNQIEVDRLNHQKVLEMKSHVLKFAQEAIEERNLNIWKNELEKFQKLSILRFFLPAFYKERKEILNQFYLSGQKLPDLAHTIKDLEAYIEWNKAERELKELMKNQIYGSYYQKLETDWSVLEEYEKWYTFLSNKISDLSSIQKNLRLKSTSSEIQVAAQKIQTALVQIRELEQQLAEYWPQTPLHSLEIESQLEEFKQKQNTFEQLEDWIEFQHISALLKANHFQTFLDGILKEQIKAEQIIPAFKKRFYRLYLDQAEKKYETLQHFQGEVHQELINKFKDLDRSQFQLNRLRVFQSLIQSFSQASNQIPAIQSTSLRKLAAQKRPRMRIRGMVKNMRDLILNIHPCWMMSPLSVAQYIELEENQNQQIFDTVIFDEASQIFPEDGLSAVFRGKQLIVAGDPLQMPPTSIARAFMEFDEEDEDEIGSDYESILDLSTSILNRRRLMWHYRSRYEELINPSNYRIYDGDLITFPRSDLPKEDPVEFHFIPDGLYEKNQNQAEAEALVNYLLQLFKQQKAENKPLSVGIIAMSIKQQDCIRDAILKLKLNDPDLESYFDEDREDESLFIKNLENVQGDERDIILISVGYAKNAKGQFYQRFGPINQKAGHRRLNVAFTRARSKVVVFCSFHHHELKVKDTSSQGVRFFRDYLRFAETGHLDMPTQEALIKYSESPFEEQILKKLLDKGYQVKAQVGCSSYKIDLAVLDPRNEKEFILGIECDGAMYQSAKTARERDRLRQDILEQAGWNMYRVWSRDWWRNTDGEFNKIVKKIETLSKERALEREQSLDPSLHHEELIRNELTDTLIIFGQAGKLGVMKNGEVLHPPFFESYDDHIFADQLFRIRSNRKFGLLNLEGDLLLEPDYDLISIHPLENGFFPIEKSGKLGLMNNKGLVILQPQFDSIEADFSLPFGLIYEEGKIGIISNETGRVLHTPTYDWFGSWTNTQAQLGKDDITYTLNIKGEITELENTSA